MTRIGTGAWLMVERDGKSTKLQVEDLTDEEREMRFTDNTETARWLNAVCNTLHSFKNRECEQPGYIRIGNDYVLLDDIARVTVMSLSGNTWCVQVARSNIIEVSQYFMPSETESHQFACDIMDKVAKHRALR